MRLLIISLNADPLLSFGTLHGGGLSKYVFEAGKNLVGRGWGIDVLTLRNQGTPQVATITEDFTVHRIARTGSRDYDYDIEVAEIADLVQRHPDGLSLNRYSVVLACYWLSGVYLRHLDENHRLPWVLSLGALGCFKQSVDSSEGVRERIVIERQLVQEFDCIISTNQGEQRALETVYGADPSKIHFIPRGVDLDLFGQFTEIPFYR
jgi:D-inositol-3-phosphate glycosyltransferase